MTEQADNVSYNVARERSREQALPLLIQFRAPG